MLTTKNLKTMELTVRARYKGKDYTISSLFVDGAKLCDVLEDPIRDLGEDGSGKIAGKTAIPGGRYEVILNESPKFGRILPLLLDVPFFEGIRIHRGNTAKDSHGCLLPGENRKRGQVINSGYYEKKIVELITEAQKRKEKIYITIER